MENRKVVKIGGSNLKKINDIRKISDIITNYEQAPVVVVSAFYGITDKLINILDRIVVNPNEIENFVKEISMQKQEYILELINNEVLRTSTWRIVKLLIDELSGHLVQINKTGYVEPSIKDLVLSYGERLSSVIIWGTISCFNKNCRVEFPETIGLFTDDVIGNASIDLKL